MDHKSFRKVLKIVISLLERKEVIERSKEHLLSALLKRRKFFPISSKRLVNH